MPTLAATEDSGFWTICLRQFCQSTHDKESKYEEDIRNKISEASLKHVNQYGWSKEALSAGAKELGYPGITHGLFSKGGADLVLYFQKTSNLKLVEILKQRESEISTLPPADIIEKAVTTRLQMLIPYIAKWPQAIAIMALPPNAPKALATILTMADDICYYAGDRSVDFNWYARRIGIAAIYKTTELYLIQDSSPEYELTWKFLHRRLIEAVQLNQLLMKSDTASQVATDIAMSAFRTARNILGVNWNR